MNHNPWVTARQRQIPVFLCALREASGITDGQRVWLDHRLTSIEQRCTLAHELAHIDAGHTGHQSPAVEQALRERVARCLVPFHQLLRFRESQESVWQIAEALEVTPGVLVDRLRGMTVRERRLLQVGPRHHSKQDPTEGAS